VQEKRRNTAVVKRSLISMAIMVLALALALALPMGSASAANIFDFLFGGRRPAPSAPAPAPLPAVRPYADPSGTIERYRSESGPSGAYCVRLCDGHPFPLQRVNGSAAQACASMCPAAPTKVFNGSSIDYAVSPDGKRYSALPNAFVYRKQVVDNCTCNGKYAGGLARMDVISDPTLRPGDIVATNDGLVSFRGSKGDAPVFSPVQDRNLANIRVRPTVSSNAAALAAHAEAPPPRAIEAPAPKENRRLQR
jgi:hypothetical protein